MLILLYILLFMSFYLLARNIAVFRYKIMIVNKIFDRNIQDIDNNVGYVMCAHRWREMETVSYNQMMLTFWRPLNKFYDKEFLKEIGVK